MENEIEIFKNYIFWTEINMELGFSGFFLNLKRLSLEGFN